MSKKRSIWVGWDSREIICYLAARASIERRLNIPVPVKAINLRMLEREGLYTRPTEIRTNRDFFGDAEVSQLWDVISDAWRISEGLIK